MITKKELENCFAQMKDVAYVMVKGDGYHYQLTIVTDLFANMNKLTRQRWVYAKLKQYIVDKTLHAVSLNTFTKKEWAQK